MDIMGDFFLGAQVSEETLRAAMAHALGLPLSQVGIRTIGSDKRAVGQVVIFAAPETLPGDYPRQYLVWIDPGLAPVFPRALSAISRETGAPILIGSGETDPDINTLYLPDGSAHRVFVEQSDDDFGIRNSPEMVRLIERAGPASMRLAS